MLYRHDISGCFQNKIGEGGLSEADIEQRLAALVPAFSALQHGENPLAAALLSLSSRADDLETIESLANTIKRRFRQVIVCGSGGSGLSGRTLAAMASPHQTIPVHFLETIDPDVMNAVIARGNLAETCLIFISKSGATVETLGCYYAFMHTLSMISGTNPAEQVIAITLPGDNPLRRAAKSIGCRIIDHDHNIGGRFSVLTAVGLLPAAIAGLDIRALRRGAQTVVQALESAQKPQDCDAAVGAALHAACADKIIRTSVFFAYGERLSGLAAWWRQSWAESLGKNGRGTTPIRAMGTTDQHSQLQLYLDGPRDKFFHLLLLNRAGTGVPLLAPHTSDIAYMRGRTTGDIMAAEQKATHETLLKNGCPVRVFEIPVLTEETMGALLMHFTLEIILTAALFEVNPFDQPAVEEGKRLARAYLQEGNL